MHDCTVKCRILCCIIRYGAQMRAWVDIVGLYSQVETLDLNETDVGLLLTPLGSSTGA